MPPSHHKSLGPGIDPVEMHSVEIQSGNGWFGNILSTSEFKFLETSLFNCGFQAVFA